MVCSGTTSFVLLRSGGDSSGNACVRLCGHLVLLSSETHGQSGQAAQAKIFPPDNRPGLQAEIFEPRKKSRERDLPFHSGKRRAEAEMSAEAKCDMAIFLTTNIQAIRIGETLRIAICRAHDRIYGLPFFY